MNPANRSRIVLLVEDSDDDAFFFERAFEQAGVAAKLVRLGDGQSAVHYLERASANSPDLSRTHLMFLDLKLPVLNGFEVLQWLRDRNIQLEVMVLSGSDIETDVSLARRLGASDYLVKPITPMELKQRTTTFATVLAENRDS